MSICFLFKNRQYGRHMTRLAIARGTALSTLEHESKRLGHGIYAGGTISLPVAEMEQRGKFEFSLGPP
jgi:hypothetical protein